MLNKIKMAEPNRVLVTYRKKNTMPGFNEGQRKFVEEPFPVGHVGNTTAASSEQTLFRFTRVFNWCPSLPLVMNNLKLAAGKGTSTAKF